MCTRFHARAQLQPVPRSTSLSLACPPLSRCFAVGLYSKLTSAHTRPCCACVCTRNRAREARAHVEGARAGMRVPSQDDAGDVRQGQEAEGAAQESRHHIPGLVGALGGIVRDHLPGGGLADGYGQEQGLKGSGEIGGIRRGATEAVREGKRRRRNARKVGEGGVWNSGVVGRVESNMRRERAWLGVHVHTACTRGPRRIRAAGLKTGDGEQARLTVWHALGRRWRRSMGSRRETFPLPTSTENG